MTEALDFTKFIDWGFMSIVSAGLIWMAKSTADLNIKMGIILERVEWHQKEIEDHKMRIKVLEERR